MQKKIIIAILLAPCLLACGSGDAMVGTWTTPTPESGPRLQSITFRSDKTFYAYSPDTTSSSAIAGYYELKGKEVDFSISHLVNGVVVKQPDTATLSADGKTLSYKGSDFTKG